MSVTATLNDFSDYLKNKKIKDTYNEFAGHLEWYNDLFFRENLWVSLVSSKNECILAKIDWLANGDKFLEIKEYKTGKIKISREMVENGTHRILNEPCKKCLKKNRYIYNFSWKHKGIKKLSVYLGDKNLCWYHFMKWYKKQ